MEDLGFKQVIPWYRLKECLPNIACHTRQIAPYFDRAYDKMAEAEVKELQQMYIFASEEGELYRIGDLHIPDADGLHLRLQLPIIRESSGHNSQQVLEPLKKMGLRSNPELGVLISKACNSDENIRQSAFNYLVANLEKLYHDYEPEDFANYAFIPCEHADATDIDLGTPEQVSPSHEHPACAHNLKVINDPRWELLGFRIPHHSLDKLTVAHLKIKQKPSIKAIVDVLRKSPPETQDVAQRCFELFEKTLTSEEGKQLADLDIVPITDSKTNSFNDAARGLTLCGAKPQPSPADIIEALRERAQDYLEIVGSQDKTPNLLDCFYCLADLYKAMGAKDLAACVRCTIKAWSGDGRNSHKVDSHLHKDILDRIELFLQNYDGEKQYYGNPTEWRETLVIKQCQRVDLYKDLYLGDVRVDHWHTQALAGVEAIDKKHSILWVKVENNPLTYKLWYE
ncbi:hypothetical protein ID866_6620 [Astraeus odoratus]|nr:hypothetical protein ID866_6620 [Astraeus odoratus]